MLRSTSASSLDDIGDVSYAESARSLSIDASEKGGIVQATNDWRKTYLDYVKRTQDRQQVPSKKTIEAFRRGIPWNDLFPRDQPHEWPSTASLRAVIISQLGYKPDVFAGLSEDLVQAFDQRQAIDHMERLRNNEDRVKIGFDEVCALPLRCTKAFLASCATSETARLDLGHFIDFIKETLSADNPDTRYDKRTHLAVGAAPVQSNNKVTQPPRYLEHQQLFKKLRSDPHVVTVDDAARILVLHLFESAVSPFDPAPIARMLEDTKPLGWPGRGTPELWGAKLCEVVQKRYSDLGGKENTHKTTMLRQIAYKAIEIETGVSIPLVALMPRPFQSMGIRDLNAVLNVSAHPKSPTFRGRREMLHLLEQAFPDSINALQDLLDAARLEEEHAGTPNNTMGEKQAFRLKWATLAARLWLTAIESQVRTQYDGTVKKNDPNHEKNWVTGISKIAIQEWWPDAELGSVPTSKLTARVSKLDSPNGYVSGWITKVLKRPNGVAHDGEMLRKMLKPLAPETEEGARQIVNVIKGALPDEPRPDDQIPGERWDHRAHHAARDALFMAVSEKSTDKVVPRRTVLDRFASFAVSELSGAKDELSLAAEHTDNAHMLHCLHRLETHAAQTGELTDTELLTVMQIARDIDIRAEGNEHFFLDTLRSSRPCGQRPVDDEGGQWDAAWRRDALTGVRKRFGDLKTHRKSALERLVGIAIDDWAAAEKIPLPERDKMVPYRDTERPGERVYGWLAGPDGQLHPEVELDRLAFPRGQKDHVSGWLASNAHLDGKAMSARKAHQLVDSMRRDAKDLVECLFGFKEGEPPVRGVGLPLRADDLPEHEKPMAEGGHWGFWMKRPERPEDAFTAENGRIAGIYVGIPFGVDEDGHPLLPPGEHVNRAISGAENGVHTQGIAGTAFSGSTSMANVSLLPDPENPALPIAAYDFARTNALWMALDQTIIDPDHQKKTLPVLALVVSDRVFSQPRSQTESETGISRYEVRVNCGPDFLTKLAGELGIAPPTAEALEAADDDHMEADFDLEESDPDDSDFE